MTSSCHYNMIHCFVCFNIKLFLPGCLNATIKEDRQFIRSLMSSHPYDVDVEQEFAALEKVTQYDISQLRFIYGK